MLFSSSLYFATAGRRFVLSRNWPEYDRLAASMQSSSIRRPQSFLGSALGARVRLLTSSAGRGDGNGHLLLDCVAKLSPRLLCLLRSLPARLPSPRFADCGVDAFLAFIFARYPPWDAAPVVWFS